MTREAQGLRTVPRGRRVFGNGYPIGYGVGIASHPYDGVNEKRRNVFLTLSVTLQ